MSKRYYVIAEVEVEDEVSGPTDKYDEEWIEFVDDVERLQMRYAAWMGEINVVVHEEAEVDIKS